MLQRRAVVVARDAENGDAVVDEISGGGVGVVERGDFGLEELNGAGGV